MSFAVRNSDLGVFIVCSFVSYLRASSQLDQTHCNATLHAESAKITCYFDKDITKIRPIVVTIEHYYLDNMKPEEVLICTWTTEAENNCETKAGYEMKGTANTTLYLAIINVTPDKAGLYACKMMYPDAQPPSPKPCQLVLEVTAPIHSTTATVHPKENKATPQLILTESNEATKPPGKSDVSGVDAEVIVGSVVAVVAIIAIVITLTAVWFCRRQKRKLSNTKKSTQMTNPGSVTTPLLFENLSQSGIQNSETSGKEKINSEQNNPVKNPVQKAPKTFSPIVGTQMPETQLATPEGGTLRFKCYVTLVYPADAVEQHFRRYVSISTRTKDQERQFMNTHLPKICEASALVEVSGRGEAEFQKPFQLYFPHGFSSLLSDDIHRCRVFWITRGKTDETILKCLPQKQSKTAFATETQTDTFYLAEGEVCIDTRNDFGRYVCVLLENSSTCISGCTIEHSACSTQPLPTATDGNISLVDINNDLHMESSGTQATSEEKSKKQPIVQAKTQEKTRHISVSNESQALQRKEDIGSKENLEGPAGLVSPGEPFEEVESSINTDVLAFKPLSDDVVNNDYTDF